MTSEQEIQKAKLLAMCAFWGWRVRPEDVRLEWHLEADLALAVWCVWHRGDNGVLRRSWAITEPSGLLPIDYVHGEGVPNAHAALRTFALRWQQESGRSLEERLGPEKTATVRRTNPAMLQQAERLREMLGVAAELLLDCAEEEG